VESLICFPSFLLSLSLSLFLSLSLSFFIHDLKDLFFLSDTELEINAWFFRDLGTAFRTLH
jgi:hypothetical protein